MSGALRDNRGMWTCPVCGQSFVTRNMPHSCQVLALDGFFAGSELRELFERFVAAARESGSRASMTS